MELRIKIRGPCEKAERGIKVIGKIHFQNLEQIPSRERELGKLASKAEVQKASSSGGILVDNRPHNQFLGINRHGKSKRNGTIPNSKNLPENWMTKNGGGAFRDRSELTKLYKLAGVPQSGEQINFCNTGHWASLGWFASSEIMGNTNAKLYDGSMVEWSADKTLPIQSALAK